MKVNDINAPKSKWKEDDGRKKVSFDTNLMQPNIGKNEETDFTSPPNT